MLGTCCSYRGNDAARELGALGEVSLAERLFEDLTAEEAEAFADELHAAADRLEEKHATDDPKPHGAGWNGRFDPEAKQIVWGNFSTFDDALASVRTAAKWYRKVSSYGFGVRAWG